VAGVVAIFAPADGATVCAGLLVLDFVPDIHPVETTTQMTIKIKQGRIRIFRFITFVDNQYLIIM
jgi:hypothetical protein